MNVDDDDNNEIRLAAMVVSHATHICPTIPRRIHRNAVMSRLFAQNMRPACGTVFKLSATRQNAQINNQPTNPVDTTHTRTHAHTHTHRNVVDGCRVCKQTDTTTSQHTDPLKPLFPSTRPTSQYRTLCVYAYARVSVQISHAI